MKHVVEFFCIWTILHYIHFLLILISVSMQVVAQWRRWSITKNWDYATKSALTSNVKWAIKKEIFLLQKLNDHWINRVPQITTIFDDWFEYMWIVWEHFESIYSWSDLKRQHTLTMHLLNCAYKLDQLWIIHGELHRPTKNVLVWNDDTVYILDFERWYFGDTSWKNMKAVWQRMARVWYVGIDVLQSLNGKSIDKIFALLSWHISNRSVSNTQMYQFLKNHSTVLIWIVGFLTVDLFSKYIFYSLERESNSLFLEPILNYWSARSLPIPHWLTRLWGVLVITLVFYEYNKQQLWTLSACLIIAWTLWNSIDRILYWWVRDFIDIRYIFEYPIFNAADIFLVVWVSIYLYHTIFPNSYSKNK